MKEVAGHVANWGENILDRGNSKYKGPEVEILLTYCGTPKEASVAEKNEQGESCSRWSQRNWEVKIRQELAAS